MFSALFDDDAWEAVPGFELDDITYHRAVDQGTVRIAFDRPEVRNAFRPGTVDELFGALDHAIRANRKIAAIGIAASGVRGLALLRTFDRPVATYLQPAQHTGRANLVALLDGIDDAIAAAGPGAVGAAGVRCRVRVRGAIVAILAHVVARAPTGADGRVSGTDLTVRRASVAQ